MGEDWKERLLIRELVENWAVWRDAGDWARFRTLWHDDGRMMATWFQGTADEFIAVSREGFEKGVSILHFLGGTAIDLAGERAIAQSLAGCQIGRAQRERDAAFSHARPVLPRAADRATRRACSR